MSDSDYLAYCDMCRDSLSAAGKRVIHILDLFFPPEDADPADLPVIGRSERRENRARLKTRMLREIWGEEGGLVEGHQEIRLIIGPEVRDLMERRLILIEDLQMVIRHAEKTGDRLLHPESVR